VDQLRATLADRERSFASVGPEVGTGHGEFNPLWHVSLIVPTRDLEGYLTYRDNPEHRQIIAEFRPIIAVRAAIQYEF
jgi:hypothetical protein